MKPFQPFENEEKKNKQIRTMIYGDIWVTKWELEVLHTRCYQRLYDLKQLGFTDRVYPDAIHSRFNHSLGVLEQADCITRWCLYNLRSENKSDLFNLLSPDIDLIRLVALLHDLFHVPFGHTLEDELHLFERHDKDQSRKIQLLDKILRQMMFWLFYEQATYHDGLTEQDLSELLFLDEVGSLPQIEQIYNAVAALLPGFRDFLRIFAKACEICLFMGGETIYEINGAYWPCKEAELCMAHKLLDLRQPLFDPNEEYFIVDIIGNTISADLLDYALRDMAHTGLKASYDQRLLQYFTMVQQEEDVKVLGGGDTALRKVKRNRIAIRLFKGRLRIDSLSEILQILNLRYLLAERVLFHRTKCAAGAMLGKCVELVAMDANSKEYLFSSGDLSFLDYLEKKAKESLAEKSPEKEGYLSSLAALRLIHGLRSRRYYKPVFHMKSIHHLSPQAPNHPARKLLELNSKVRRDIETAIEQLFGFPAGTVIIYCPEKTHLKEAECLVVVDSQSTVKKVKDLKGYRDFELFGAEASDLANKYEILWNLYVFVPERFAALWCPIQQEVLRLYNEEYKPAQGEQVRPDEGMQSYLKEEYPESVELAELYTQCGRAWGDELFYGAVRQTVENPIQRLLNESDKKFSKTIIKTVKRRLEEAKATGQPGGRKQRR